jgi:hypothetical protein
MLEFHVPASHDDLEVPSDKKFHLLTRSSADECGDEMSAQLQGTSATVWCTFRIVLAHTHARTTSALFARARVRRFSTMCTPG